MEDSQAKEIEQMESFEPPPPPEPEMRPYDPKGGYTPDNFASFVTPRIAPRQNGMVGPKQGGLLASRQVSAAGDLKAHLFILVVTASMILGFLVYDFYQSKFSVHSVVGHVGKSSIELVSSLWKGEAGEEDTPAAIEVPTDNAEAKRSYREDYQPVRGNPYWHLPNIVVRNVRKERLPLSYQDRTSASVRLGHRFTYQRYQAVRDLRKNSMAGSEALFLAAIDQPKFWTRMEALLGIVEAGFVAPRSLIKKAIGDARPSLVKNYVKRFANSDNWAGAYLSRHMLPLIGPRGRVEILKGMTKKDDTLRDLYLVAASTDPSKRVQNWLNWNPTYNSISKKDRRLHMQLVKASITPTTWVKRIGGVEARATELPVRTLAKKGESLPPEKVAIEVAQNDEKTQKLFRKRSKAKDDGFEDLEVVEIYE